MGAVRVLPVAARGVRGDEGGARRGGPRLEAGGGAPALRDGALGARVEEVVPYLEGGGGGVGALEDEVDEHGAVLLAVAVEVADEGPAPRLVGGVEAVDVVGVEDEAEAPAVGAGGAPVVFVAGVEEVIVVPVDDQAGGAGRGVAELGGLVPRALARDADLALVAGDGDAALAGRGVVGAAVGMREGRAVEGLAEVVLVGVVPAEHPHPARGRDALDAQPGGLRDVDDARVEEGARLRGGALGREVAGGYEAEREVDVLLRTDEAEVAEHVGLAGRLDEVARLGRRVGLRRRHVDDGVGEGGADGHVQRVAVGAADAEGRGAVVLRDAAEAGEGGEARVGAHAGAARDAALRRDEALVLEDAGDAGGGEALRALVAVADYEGAREGAAGQDLPVVVELVEAQDYQLVLEVGVAQGDDLEARELGRQGEGLALGVDGRQAEEGREAGLVGERELAGRAVVVAGVVADAHADVLADARRAPEGDAEVGRGLLGAQHAEAEGGVVVGLGVGHRGRRDVGAPAPALLYELVARPLDDEAPGAAVGGVQGDERAEVVVVAHDQVVAHVEQAARAGGGELQGEGLVEGLGLGVVDGAHGDGVEVRGGEGGGGGVEVGALGYLRQRDDEGLDAGALGVAVERAAPLARVAEAELEVAADARGAVHRQVVGDPGAGAERRDVEGEDVVAEGREAARRRGRRGDRGLGQDEVVRGVGRDAEGRAPRVVVGDGDGGAREHRARGAGRGQQDVYRLLALDEAVVYRLQPDAAARRVGQAGHRDGGAVVLGPAGDAGGLGRRAHDLGVGGVAGDGQDAVGVRRGRGAGAREAH